MPASSKHALELGLTFSSRLLRIGGFLLLTLAGLPALAQDQAPMDAPEIRRRAFEIRYREAATRGEADSPEWQDRYRARLQSSPNEPANKNSGDGTTAPGLQPDVQGDRDALIALFQSTGGTGWFSKGNWGSSRPIEEWSDVVVENGRVVALTLSDNNLVGPLPAAIGDLTALRELELDGNRISGSLPATMGNLGALKKLYLDANRVSGELPQGLGTLAGLERVVLDDNLLEDVPDLSAASSALVLAVRRNRLTFEDIEPSIGFFDFRYAPQLPVGELKTNDVASGAPATLQIPVGGANNRYRWFKNGVAVAGATSDTYAISSAATADAGVYVLEITNTVATRPGASSTNLILRSLPQILRVGGVGPGESPVAAADSTTTPLDTPVIIDVLANDVDPQGDDLTVEAITRSPGRGTAVVNLNFTVTYTPGAGFEGADTFEYRVTDPDGNAATGQVLIRVGSGAANRAPVAVDDAVQTEAGQAVIITVLENDSDPDGDALILTGVSEEPEHGTAVANADRTITYTPEDGFSGEDDFTYVISDGLLSASARVVVQVGGPVNRAPIARDDVAETIRDNAVIIDVLSNDSDPEGSALVVTGIAEGPTRGSVAVRGDQTIAYAPESGFVGTDTFVYGVSDGFLAVTARVTISVLAPPNPPPVAVDDDAETERDVPIEIAVLGNDTDPNGDALAVVGVGTVAIGS